MHFGVMRPAMSDVPRHQGNVSHRPDTGQSRPHRRRDEDQGVGSSVPRVAARMLGPGVIILATLLAPMAGRAADHHHAVTTGMTTWPPARAIILCTANLRILINRPARRTRRNQALPHCPAEVLATPIVRLVFIAPNLPARPPASLVSHDRTWPETLETSQPRRTPMTEPLTFDELHEVSPMFRALRNQLDAFEPYELSFDMTALWKAAGRPRGHAPRHYPHRFRDTTQGHVRDQGGGPDGAVLADYETAMHYCMMVDCRIMRTVVHEGVRKRRQDPVRALMACRDPLMAMFVKTDLHLRGLSDEQADRVLIDAAKRAAAGLDVYAEETFVAEVQRAVASFGPIVEEPSSGSGRPD